MKLGLDDYKTIWLMSYCLNFQNEVNLLNRKKDDITTQDLEAMCTDSCTIATAAVAFLQAKQETYDRKVERGQDEN